MDNFVTFYLDVDADVRNYLSTLDALDSLAQVLLVAVLSYPVMPHRHCCY
jgi:hypothetical protein